MIPRERALEIYFKANGCAQKTLNLIQLWDESMTIKENSSINNLYYQLSLQLANRYNLNYRRLHGDSKKARKSFNPFRNSK